MMGELGVETATFDQCLYGCSAADGSPMKKPTTFLTNAPELAKQLRARCMDKNGRRSRPEGGQHTQCRGKNARMAAVYDFKLCRAILVGFRNHLRADGMYKDGFVGMLEERKVPEELPILPILQLTASDGAVLNVRIEDEPVYKDDLTGQLLPPELVRIARAQELEYFNAKAVWEKRPIWEARSEEDHRQATHHGEMGGRQQR